MSRGEQGHLYVRAPNWVGDLVMATPVLHAAIQDPRFTRVSIGVRAHLASVLAGGALEPHLIPLAKGADERSALATLAPDVALLLSNSFGAAWRVFRAGIPVRIGSGLSSRRWLLSHACLPPTSDGRRVPIPTAHLLRDVAGLAGILVPDLHPRLDLPREVREAQGARLSELGIARGEDYVVCCPGAAFGAAKLWPPEHFALALDVLTDQYGWRAVVTGGPGEEALIDEVARRTRHGAISLSSEHRDLVGLKALVADARLLLVGDSGPRWYAAAFDVPCVSVIGPNFPELTASSLEFAEVVRVEGLECSPCLERVCPLEHHRCMRELAPSRVIDAAGRVLARKQKAGA
ncbi:MAG TPA: glycosyltransferase family 9 protein [Planctomycetota bacterium]|nr:glycosyltransferase family 9 protein [Planctomycetota bacterium]